MKKEIVVCDRCGADASGRFVELRLSGVTRRDLCPACVEIVLATVSAIGVPWTITAKQTSTRPPDGSRLAAANELRAYLADLHQDWLAGANAEDLRRGLLRAISLAARV